MAYRYDIGLDKYPYGNELEFVNASLQKLAKSFQKTKIPIEFLLDHKTSDTVYDRNYLDKDATVSEEKGDTIYGGEISSRLYQNKKIAYEVTDITKDLLTIKIQENICQQKIIEIKFFNTKKKIMHILLESWKKDEENK